VESQGSISLPLLDDLVSEEEGNVWELEFMREGSRKSTMVRFFGSRISILDRIRSYIDNPRSRLRNSAAKSQ